MKATGIVRKVDELGRIVLPKKFRDVLNIEIKDPLEIYTDGDFVMLKKYNPGCTICGNIKDNILFKDKLICKECREQFSL